MKDEGGRMKPDERDGFSLFPGAPTTVRDKVGAKK